MPGRPPPGRGLHLARGMFPGGIGARAHHPGPAGILPREPPAPRPPEPDGGLNSISGSARGVDRIGSCGGRGGVARSESVGSTLRTGTQGAHAMATVFADRNLVVSILALQHGLIDRDTLV